MMSHFLSIRPGRAGTKRPRTAALTLAAGLLLALGSAALAQDADPVVARVNGAEIRASDVTMAEEELGSESAADDARGKARLCREFPLADTLLVAQAAEARKLGDTPEFKRRPPSPATSC